MQKYLLVLFFCVVSPFISFAQFSDQASDDIKRLMQFAIFGFDEYQLKEISRTDTDLEFSSNLEIDGTKNNKIYLDAGYYEPSEFWYCTYIMDLIDEVKKENSDLILDKYKNSIAEIGENKYIVEAYVNKDTNQEGFNFLDEKTKILITLYKQKNKGETYNLKMSIYYDNY